MFEGPREDFYVRELRVALKDYEEASREAERIASIRQAKQRLVRNLLSVMSLQMGEARVQEVLERHHLLADVRAFRGPEEEAAPRRGRGGRPRRPVDPAEVLATGTRVKMTSGKYRGLEGEIASAQVRTGRRGLDVTYFMNLEDPSGRRRRTSVKHGTMNKTWIVLR